MTYAPSYSGRRVYWANQETINAFRAEATNTAGSFDLATDGTLVCGRPARGQTLLWTTTDLWTMTWIGGTLVYSFAQAGKHCGIISQQAPIVLDTAAFWMGTDHRFFRYDGFVSAVACDVQDYVFGNFNDAASDQVWALANPPFNEITWFYPSSLSSTCDRYVTYNHVEGHWVFGALGRTAGVSHAVGTHAPVLFDASGVGYDHETGNKRFDVPPLGEPNPPPEPPYGNAFVESGPIELGDGDRIVRVQRIVPDDKTQGDVKAQLYLSFFPDQSESTTALYALANPTSIRATARQVRIRLQEAAQSAWRVGVVRLGGVLGGRR